VAEPGQRGHEVVAVLERDCECAPGRDPLGASFSTRDVSRTGGGQGEGLLPGGRRRGPGLQLSTVSEISEARQ